jgi:hypothetical protein
MSFPGIRPDALLSLAIPGFTPQAPVLGPERVQLSSRDQNHVISVCGHVNSSPSRGLFTSEFSRDLWHLPWPAPG